MEPSDAKQRYCSKDCGNRAWQIKRAQGLTPAEWHAIKADRRCRFCERRLPRSMNIGAIFCNRKCSGGWYHYRKPLSELGR